MARWVITMKSGQVLEGHSAIMSDHEIRGLLCNKQVSSLIGECPLSGSKTTTYYKHSEIETLVVYE